MVRSVKVGPTEVDVADTLIVGVHLKIPAGATLTYASLAPTNIQTPNIVGTITLYFTKDEAITQYPYPLKIGYCSRNSFRPVPLVWQGHHRLDDNYEHNLELSIYNLTGATVTIRGLCVYEIEERGRGP